MGNGTMTIRPDAYEQHMLELINQARMDPSGEFARLITDAGTQTAATANITSAIQFFNVNLNELANQFSGLTPVAPLAWSDQLSQSATTHSQLMIANDLQSHNLPGEPGLGDRVEATGFQFQTIGENIFLYGEDALYSHAAFFIDWGNTATGIQSPPGHRNTIMDGAKKEIGIGVIAEDNPNTQAGPNVITQHIGTSFTTQQKLVGVVINDADNDNFYDIGEGVSGVTVTATGASGTFTTTTWDSGGYQLDLANGNYTVEFRGVNVNTTTTVTISNNNTKLDAKTGGANNSGPTNGNDIFVLTSGNDNIDGLLGLDSAVFGVARSQLNVSKNGNIITATGQGTDTLVNIERLVFTDGTLAFDIDGIAGQAYRIYKAAFNRTPDNDGLKFWIGELDKGMSLVQAASGFVGSAEFNSVYGGATNNLGIVQKFYQNVLGREGEAGGVSYWTGELDSGSKSTAQVLADFSASPENVAGVAPLISDGIFIA
jgi:serralysin